MLHLERPPEIVGRDRQLAAVRKALETAERYGTPATLRVAGEPGIGKTLFTDHLLLQAQEAGWLTLRTTCHDLQRHTPFIAATRLVLSFLQQTPDAARYVSGLEAGLASLDPAIALRLEREPMPSPSRARYEEVYLRFFDGIGSDHKILLLCDDAQWMDPGSRDVLAALVANYSVAPLALIAAERPDSASPSPGETIELMPLSTREAAALTRSRFPEMPAVAAEAAVQYGNGNPFHILTLCEEFAAGQATQEISESSIRELVAERVRSMQPADRDFLQICALLGEPIEYRTLFALYSPSEVAGLVSGTARSYLMAEGAALRFRHALVADAVRSAVEFGLPLHTRIIAALESIQDKSYADYERIADHARAIGDLGLAFDQYIEMARHAFSRRAWRTAISACESALRVHEVDDRHFVDFYMLYAQTLRLNNEDLRAADVLQEALDTARRRGITRRIGELLAIFMATLWVEGRSEEAIAAYRAFEPVASGSDLENAAASAMHIAACKMDGTLFAEVSRRFESGEALAGDAAKSTAHTARSIYYSLAGDQANAIRYADLSVSAASATMFQNEPKLWSRILIDFRGTGCAVVEQRLPAWLDRNKSEGRTHDFGAVLQAAVAFSRGDWALARSTAETSLNEDITVPAMVQLQAILGAIASLTGDPEIFAPHRNAAERHVRDSGDPDYILQLGPWLLAQDHADDLQRRLHQRLLSLSERPASPVALAYFPFGIALLAEKTGNRAWLDFLTRTKPIDRCAWSQMQWNLACGIALKALKDSNAGTVLADTATQARVLNADFLAAYGSLRAGAPTKGDTALLERNGVMRPGRSHTKSPLSAREAEVAQLVSQGKSNRGVAEQLFLSERTIERHLGNIFAKLQLESRAQLIRWSFENRL